MKSIVRKQNRQINEAPLEVLKRTSGEADRELAHLTKVIGILVASGRGALPLGTAYWLERLRKLRDGHTLLPTQLAHISALERSVEGLAELHTQDAGSSRRRAA